MQAEIQLQVPNDMIVKVSFTCEIGDIRALFRQIEHQEIDASSWPLSTVLSAFRSAHYKAEQAYKGDVVP